MQDVMNGYNAAILAYGQTGSGKTYTLMNTSDDSRQVAASAAHFGFMAAMPKMRPKRVGLAPHVLVCDGLHRSGWCRAWRRRCSSTWATMSTTCTVSVPRSCRSITRFINRSPMTIVVTTVINDSYDDYCGDSYNGHTDDLVLFLKKTTTIIWGPPEQRQPGSLFSF